MRKLVVCGLVAVGCASVAGVALATSGATNFSVKQTARVEGASTAVKFKIGFGDPDAPNGVPSGLKSFKIKLHKGAKIDGRGAPQCRTTEEELMSKGVAACPGLEPDRFGHRRRHERIGHNREVPVGHLQRGRRG